MAPPPPCVMEYMSRQMAANPHEMYSQAMLMNGMDPQTFVDAQKLMMAQRMMMGQAPLMGYGMGMGMMMNGPSDATQSALGGSNNNMMSQPVDREDSKPAAREW